MRLLKCTFLAAALCLFARAAQPDAGRLASTVVSQAGVTQYLVGFAQVAYGSWVAGGYWTTTFIFRNDSATAATVTLHFFTDAGQPLSAPVVGGQRAADQTFTVPAGGATEIQFDPASDPLTVGWAAVDYTNLGIKGQGVFTQHFPDGTENEAVVSMVDQRSPACIIPLPGTSGYSMPFDNTPGRVSSYAFANTTNATVTLHARFFGPSGEALGEITQDIPAFGHTAFETAGEGRPASLANAKGTMRIEGAGIIPLGFRFSPPRFTTWLER